MNRASFSRTGPGGTAQSPGTSAQNQGRTGLRKRPKPAKPTEGSFSQGGSKEDKQPIWTFPLYRTSLPVTCGEKQGSLHRERLSKGEPCVSVEGRWFSPREFEELAGRGSSKKWKKSIFCNRTPLSKLFEEGHLTSPPLKRRKPGTATGEGRAISQTPQKRNLPEASDESTNSPIKFTMSGPIGAENDGAGFSRTGPDGTAQSPGTSAQNQGRTGPGKRPKPAKPTHKRQRRSQRIALYNGLNTTGTDWTGLDWTGLQTEPIEERMSEISERGRDTATQTQRVDTSSLKRGPETHAEGSPAKRVREDNRSLEKTRPLPTVKNADFAVVKRELSRVRRELTTVKGERDTLKQELTTVKQERTTLKRELTSMNRKLTVIQPRRGSPGTDLSAGPAGQPQALQSTAKTLPSVSLNPISTEQETEIYSANFDRCDKYAIRIFKSLVNPEILRQWACKVNFHGNRGKQALPRNVIEAVFAQVDERFPQIGPLETQAIRNKINKFLRRPNAASQHVKTAGL